MTSSWRLILASSSPRRREILALLQVAFEVVAPEFDEVLSEHRAIAEEVMQFARGKAESVARAHPGAAIIGSDTMIELDGRKLGKPADSADARRMLADLSGRTHTIYTSVVILDQFGATEALVTVEVAMRRLSAAEIDGYVQTGESLDKAGAYSIQGRGGGLIRSIEGDYLAAVGLPLRPVAEYLTTRGVPHADIEAVYAGRNFYNWREFASRREQPANL